MMNDDDRKAVLKWKADNPKQFRHPCRHYSSPCDPCILSRTRREKLLAKSDVVVTHIDEGIKP